MVSPEEAKQAERDAHVKVAKARPSELEQLAERLELKAEFHRNQSDPHSAAVYVALKEIADAVKELKG